MAGRRGPSAGRRRAGVPLGSVSARVGGVRLAEVQRSRMMSSAAQVVSEHGYGQMSVARVTARARVSRRTFYDVFEDREDCFLAVFDDALERVSERVVCAYERERVWREQVRAALSALLVLLDEQPEIASLLIVNALRAGPRVLERRARVLKRLGAVLQADGSQAGSRAGGGRGLPPLTGEGVVGAVFSMIHTRLLEQSPGPLVGLLNPLMGMIVLPYQGPAAARKELARPAPEIARRETGTLSSGRMSAGLKSPARFAGSSLAPDPLAGLPMRLTYRTLRVFTAIAEQPGSSNREVAERAGVADQGQMSKLLGRLERLGLIRNTAPKEHHQSTGMPNSWCLTPRGEEIEHVTQARSGQASNEINGMEGTRR
jgi:AcrR family transcriptional regulator